MAEPDSSIHVPVWQFITAMSGGLVLWTGTVIGCLTWLNARLPRDYEARHSDIEKRLRAVELYLAKDGYAPPL